MVWACTQVRRACIMMCEGCGRGGILFKFKLKNKFKFKIAFAHL